MDLQDKACIDESIEKYKARFVARGFSQKEGIDYEETFTLVARYTSIRTIMELASMMSGRFLSFKLASTYDLN